MDYTFMCVMALVYVFGAAFTTGGLWVIFYGKDEKASWPVLVAGLLFPITLVVCVGFMFGALVFDKKGGL